MKVRIQQGNASIEVEGDEPEVAGVLSRWWLPLGDTTARSAPLEDEPDTKQVKRRTSRRSAPKTSSIAKDSASKINAEAIANRVKEDARFGIFKEKIIIGDASRLDRARFVSWFVGDEFITSGDVLRVMLALSVKFDAPKASKAMADSPSDWLKDTSGSQTTYKLSAAARDEFEKRLLSAEKSST